MNHQPHVNSEIPTDPDQSSHPKLWAVLILVFFLAVVLTSSVLWWKSSVHSFFSYTSQREQIPEDRFVGVDMTGYYEDGIVLTQNLIGMNPSFECQEPEIEAEQREFFRFYQGSVEDGVWVFRYAVICNDQYYIVDGISSGDIRLAGPFALY